MNYRQSMLGQNTWAFRTPINGRLGIYNGSYVDAPSGTIMFLDANGNTIQTAECGQPMQFIVKDYVQVWLTQTQDGRPQWNGPIDVPATYTTSCFNAPGAYHGKVFDMAMIPIGEYDFTITGSILSGLGTPLLIGGGALAVLLMMKRRRRSAA